MAVTTSPDIERMRDSVFFDGPDQSRRVSRFWILLILASIIASAGVVADSTATVIGAMIVAPLMTPILATMLSVVLADRLNLARSVLFVLGGAAAAIAVGWVVGLLVQYPVLEATNSQVAARVHPRLIDLLAALATGAVGSISLVRSDISDTLPGVAIAISLVPPLTVVGLTLESGEPSQAFGALLLFATNVTAIVATGIIVMAVYRVRPPALDAASPRQALNRRRAVGIVAVVSVVIVAVLAATSIGIIRDTRRESIVSDEAKSWAEAAHWELINVSTDAQGIVIRVEGSLPEPDTDSLRARLLARGINVGTVEVDMVPVTEVHLAD